MLFLIEQILGNPIVKFGGDQLVQQEPDASSFPSGGIRNTFEARGYTAWDPSSPAFVYGTTLWYSQPFLSPTPEKHWINKTPLLKSLHALDKAATEVCRYFDKKHPTGYGYIRLGTRIFSC